MTERTSDKLVEELFDLLNSIDIDQIEEKKDDEFFGEFPHTYIWKHRTPSKKILKKQLKVGTTKTQDLPYTRKDLNKITRQILKAFNLQVKHMKLNNV